jgi:hypothetical protein
MTILAIALGSLGIVCSIVVWSARAFGWLKADSPK